MARFIKQVNDLLSAVISHKIALLSYVFLAFLFVLPVLIAGVDYIDDTSRKLEGSYQWGGLGRVATEALMHMVTFSAGDMVDVGNLPQLLSIPLLAVAAYLVAKIVARGGFIVIRDWLVGALVVVNPLLLPNLSFRFDSLSMILGYTVSIFAGYFFLRSEGFKRYLVSLALLLLSIMLYQVTVMMFAVVVVLGFTIQYVDTKRRSDGYLFPVLLKAAATLGAAFFVYYGIVKVVGFQFLVGQRSSLVSLDIAGLRQIKENYTGLLTVLSDYVRNIEGLVVVGLLVIVGAASLAFIVYKKGKKTNIIDTIVFVSLPILMFLIIIGPLVLMQSSISLQVRVLMSAIGLPLLYMVAIHSLPRLGFKAVSAGLVVGVIFITYFMNMSFVYGAALKQQREFDRTVYQSIANVITNDEQLFKSAAIYVGGETAYPMVVQNIIDKRPIFNRLDIAGDNTRWYIFNNLKDHGSGMGIDQYSASGKTHDLRKAVCGFSHNPIPYVNAEYFSIYKGNSNEYLVWLTDPFTNQNLICSLE